MSLATLQQVALSLATEIKNFGGECEKNSYTEIDDAEQLMESIIESLRPFPCLEGGEESVGAEVYQICSMIFVFSRQGEKTHSFDTDEFWNMMENNAPNSIRAILERIGGEQH